MGLLLYKNESDKNLKEINQKYKSKNQPTPPSAPRKCQTHFWGQSRLVNQACQAEEGQPLPCKQLQFPSGGCQQGAP